MNHRSPGARPRTICAFFGALSLLAARRADAFNFGEHHDIGAAAVHRLPEPDRKRLAVMWSTIDGAGRACGSADDASFATRKTASCVAFADLLALAGDHACTATDLEDDIRRNAWTLPLIARAMQTRRDVVARDPTGDFMQMWRRSDIDLQLIDGQYGSRAAANDAHFALPRASDTLSRYLYEALEIDTPPLNAVGLYAIFHGGALRLAVAAHEEPDDGKRTRLRARSLLSEAFALHFLEDLFSSGHIVGTFGSVSTKKGTHDDFCRRGLDVRTWNGVSYEAHGDFHMQGEDLEHASLAVATSIRQVLAADAGVRDVTEAASAVTMAGSETMAAVDVCTAVKTPTGLVPRALWPLLEEVLGQTPVPARMTTLLPRSSAEVGVFLGAWVGARGVAAFESNESNPVRNSFADLELDLRFGVNLQDVLGPVADGQFFLEVGTLAGIQERPVPDYDPRFAAGDTRSIAHQGNKFALRMPFFLVPGDLALAAPFLLPFSRRTLEAMALTAAYGGLVPWQRPIPTRAGTVQFVLGRKVDFFLYRQRVLDTFAPGATKPDVFVYRSYGFGLPVVEWAPLRNYQSNDAFGFKVQLGAAIEVPYGARNLTTNEAWSAPRPSTQLVLSLGLWGHHYL